MLCPHVIQKPDILRQRAPKMFNPFPSFLEADIYDKDDRDKVSFVPTLPPELEEAKRAGMIGNPVLEEEDDDQGDIEVFPEHEDQCERYRRRMNYGPNGVNNNAVVASDKLSLHVTEIAVAHFNSAVGRTQETIDRLDVGRAADITRKTATSPTSLVLALIYLERLRAKSKRSAYLDEVSSTELFLATLMVASKYLYDDGEVDEVFNDDWAEAGRLEVAEMNRLEIEFLCAVEWSLHVQRAEFEQMTQNLETAVALKRLNNHNSSSPSSSSSSSPLPPSTTTTYADLDVLSRAIGLRKMLGVLANCTVGVTAVVAAAYAVSVAAMISTVCLLDRHTPLGPKAVSASLEYLRGGGRPPSHPTAVSVVPLDADVSAAGGRLDQASLASPSPQDLPLLPVASSPSDVLTATVLGSFAKINDTGGGMRLLLPESDEDNIDNGSSARQKNSNRQAFPNFDYSVSLFRSAGENLMLWDRSPPDRHTTSMNMIRAAEEDWKQLLQLDSGGLFKKPSKKQCPLRAEYLRNSFSILSGFA